MPFALSDFLKSTCGWSFSSRGMNTLFCNKFYTSGLLTIIIVVLIMLIYPCKQGTPLWITFKLGFYIMVFTLGIMFIHDGVMYYDYQKVQAADNSNSFVNGISSGNDVVYGGDTVPVTPATYGGDGMTGDGECCDMGGGDSKTENKNSSEEIFSMFGV